MSYIITENYLSPSKYYLKSPYEMSPIGITVHNTYNDAPAINEVKYMIGNNSSTSFHVAVDDSNVIIAIPFTRTAFHAGDGKNGDGNRKTISIEICYSKSGGEKFDKSERNAAAYIATLLKEYNWTIDNIYRHKDWSGKYCPHRTLDYGWDRFLNMIKNELNKLNSGWIQDDTGWWYRNEDGSYPFNTWKQIDNNWYYFNSDGYMMTGWFQDNNIWYYLKDNGAMLTNDWAQDSIGWYYMGEDGKPVTGWYQVGTTWYYFNSDGLMATNKWVEDSVSQYYMDNDGKMTIGWLELDGKQYYFNGTGALQTGLQVIDNELFYFDANDGHLCKTNEKGALV